MKIILVGRSSFCIYPVELKKRCEEFTEKVIVNYTYALIFSETMSSASNLNNIDYKVYKGK